MGRHVMKNTLFALLLSSTTVTQEVGLPPIYGLPAYEEEPVYDAEPDAYEFVPDSFESTTSTIWSTTTQTTNPKRNQNFQPLTTEPVTTNDPTTTTTGWSTIISSTTKTSGFDSTPLVDERGVLTTDFLTTEILSTTELQKSTTGNFGKTETTTEFPALPTDFTISETNENFDDNRNFGIPPILIEEIEEIEEEGTEDYNERQASLQPDYFVKCETTTMCLYTKKQFLTDKGVIESEYADFTLKNGEPSDQNGQTCGEWRIETDPAISTDDFITFCAVPVESDFWSCGTEILTNSTHITYTNGVSFSRGSFSLEINFNCSWETDLYVAEPFGVKINPITFVSVTLPKQNRGKFPIGMHLFRDQTYALDNMFNSPPELEVGTNQNPNWMYVGIRHMEPLSGVNIQILRLWATPDDNYENVEFYNLVDQQCPGEVCNALGSCNNIFGIADSGTTNFVKYTIPVFKFPATSVVYLHAQVRICFQDELAKLGQTCETVCTNARKRRETTQVIETELLSYGPVRLTESRSEVTFEVIRGQVEEQNRILAPIIAVMILAVVVTAFIVICAIRKKTSVKEA